MVPILEHEISKREIPRRRYAIGALGILGNKDSIPILEHILQDKSEKEYFRGDALLAIAKIDLSYAQKNASNYLNDMRIVSTCANKVLTGNLGWLDKRSYWDAFYHRHD
jgi:HEAT repeat protein